MSDITYVLGTVEYIMLEVECETPGVTFVPADWGAEMYLADNATSVVIDDLTTEWKTAALETVGTKHYAKALIGTDFPQGVGTYTGFVRLTHVPPGSETPILKAAGTITIVGE